MTDDLDDIIVTARDARAASMCITPGTKAFFKKHGLDFKDFVKNGIKASILAETGDAMALIVIEVARGRQQQEANSRV